MKFFYLSFLLIALICCRFSVQAQSVPDSTKSAPKSYFRGSVGFLSNSVYNGRKDSVANPYLTAEIGFYHKSGLYLSGSASYQTVNHVFDVFSIDAGYNWTISDQFSASFNADKPFYNKTSTSVSSGIKGSLDAGLTYDADILTAEVTFSSVFSKKTDFLTTATLSHLFLIDGFDKESFWGFNPEIDMNLGTQNFFNEYKARSTKRKILSASSSTVSGSSKFQVLDYEFSLPISYEAKKWGITFSPVYAIPKNPVTSTTTLTVNSLNKTKTIVSTDTEKLRNVFYAQLSIDFKFK